MLLEADKLPKGFNIDKNLALRSGKDFLKSFKSFILFLRKDLAVRGSDFEILIHKYNKT